nr:hypothetical protein GCM10025732_48350 [Glycomyces mayteni]
MDGYCHPAIAGAAVAIARNAGLMLLQYSRIAVQATIAAARTVAAWVLMAAGAVARTAVIVGALIAQGAQWAWLGLQAMIQAARIAAAWFIAMGPIGWVIAIIIGLVALIIIYWDEIKAAISAAWDWIKENAIAVWTAISDFFSGIINGIKQFFIDMAVDFLIEWMLWQAKIKGFWEDLWNGIKNFFKGIWDFIVQFVQNKIDEFWAGVQALAQLKAKFDEWVGNAVDAAVDKFWELVEWAGNLPGEILDALGDMGSWLYNAGKDLIQGFIDGIDNMVDNVKDTLTSLTDKLTSWKGPPKRDKVIFEPAGEMAMGSFERGLKNGIPAIRSFLQGFTRDIELTTNANIRSTLPGERRGVNIENVNINAATNRFDKGELEAQLAMVV